MKYFLRILFWERCCRFVSFLLLLILLFVQSLLESGRTTNYIVSFKMTNETFRAELKDKKSSSFKSLADGLELEVQQILMYHVRY